MCIVWFSLRCSCVKFFLHYLDPVTSCGYLAANEVGDRMCAVMETCMLSWQPLYYHTKVAPRQKEMAKCVVIPTNDKD